MLDCLDVLCIFGFIFYKAEINLSVDSLAITLLQIDFAFDDADVIEEGTLVAIIGRRKLQGGESIIQEKVSFYTVFLCDDQLSCINN